MDSITYEKNEDGTFTKTTIKIEVVKELAVEIEAFKQQVEAFKKGQELFPLPEIDAAIKKYEEHIALLSP